MACVLQMCVLLFIIKTIERNEMYIYGVFTVYTRILRIFMILGTTLMSSVSSGTSF